MAWNTKEFTFSVPTSEDLSARQYQLVYLDATGGAHLCNATHEPTGVLVNQPSTGTTSAGNQYQATVCWLGITRLAVDDAYAIGTLLCSDATGVGTTAVGAKSKYVCAKVLQPSVSPLEIVTVQYGVVPSGLDTTVIS